MAEPLVPYSDSGSDVFTSPEGIGGKKNILENYAKYLLNTELSDVKILVNENDVPAHELDESCEIPTHKLVLCAQSSVFYSYFRDGVENEEKATGIVQVKDFDFDIVLGMLRFT